MMKNKLVVYTAIFGDYDNLLEPTDCFYECDFFCFTDQKHLTSKRWKVIYIDNMSLSNTLNNRFYKFLPHKFFKDYKYSLYVDANVFIKSDPSSLVDKYLDTQNFCTPKHAFRDCIYEEAKECIALNRISYKQAIKQIHKYKNNGMPKNFGLSENNIILRKHNENDVISVMENWWNEINHESQRDQLSLPYIFWKSGKVFNYIDESTRIKNNYFELKRHKSVDNTLLYKVKFKLSSTFKRFLLKLTDFK